MSDADLRPPDRAPRERQQAISNAGASRWWEPLTRRWSLLLIFVFLGLAAGVIDLLRERLSGAPVTPLGIAKKKETPTEADRPRLQAALRPSIEAYFNTPTGPQAGRTMSAIEDYRRTFPDALPVTLQAPSEKLEPCIHPNECSGRDERQKRHVASLIAQIEATHAALPRGSVARRTAVVESLASDRKIPVDAIEMVFAKDLNQIMYEQRALKNLQILFDRMDNMVTEFEGLSALEITGRKLARTTAIRSASNAFMDDARFSLKPFLFHHECRPERGAFEIDITQCTEAMRRFEEERESYRSPAPVGDGRDEGYRLADLRRKHEIEGIKKLIAERAAPVQWIERQLLEIMR